MLLFVSVTSTFHVVALQIKPPELGNPLCVSLQKLISTLQYYAAVTLQVGLLIIIIHVRNWNALDVKLMHKCHGASEQPYPQKSQVRNTFQVFYFK